MRQNALVGLIAVVVTVGFATVFGQQGGRAGGTAAQAVPDLPTAKSAFWSADDIQGRWRQNEALRRANSRLFNGPTNISANVRIVLDNDPPLVHDTTADLWIVTAGTATARTDGQVVDVNGAKVIRNGMQRPVRAGDILYVPPGVPHHFTDVKGFRAWLMRFDTLGLVRTRPAPAPPAARGAGPNAAGAQAAGARGRAAGAAPPVPDLATDKAMFWTSDDIQARWRDNEANRRINSRLFNGPANISTNVRIVLDGDPPQAHEETADLWLVVEGTAVARTDGEIVKVNGTDTIRNGMQRPVHPGDLLYVPPGVPHHFTDMRGFRAFLIRYDVLGWRQSRTEGQ